MLKSIYNSDKPLTLGILGGGQLAKMLAQAAYRMGINVAVIESSPNSPAGDMTKLDFPKGWNDEYELMKFINASDIITLENEFIDPAILEKIGKFRQVFPTAATMRLVRDKFIQKETFKNAGIPVPKFRNIDFIEDLIQFGEEYGYPFMLKTRTLGYDGYGNFTVNDKDGCYTGWEKLNPKKQDNFLMAEAYVNFTKELAVMVARNTKGETVVYPCVETIQKNHICHIVIAPADIPDVFAKEAQEYAVKCVESINGVGVFGIELFLTLDNQIMVNEIAPRPHNSGHYSIEACYTSQYENCIRAINGLPLGSTEMILPSACMYNLLGERDGSGVPTDITGVLKLDKVWLHLYNKKQSRKGRKMGHLTTLGDTREEAYDRAVEAAGSIVW